METKYSSRKWDLLKRILKFDGCLVVDLVGRSGGLALLWRLELGVTIPSYSRNHVSARIKEAEGCEEWQFTEFYGQFDASRRKEMWDLLVALKPYDNVAWMVCGNFNEILTHDEKPRVGLEVTYKWRDSDKLWRRGNYMI